MELKDNRFEDFARSLVVAYNNLTQVEILDQNSFYELGVGINQLASLIEGGATDVENLNQALRLIDGGIQKIANIPSRMFTKSDLERTRSSIVALGQVSEMTSDVSRLVEARGINDDQLRRTLSSIVDAAQRKSVGLSNLADAMEGYFSTRF